MSREKEVEEQKAVRCIISCMEDKKKNANKPRIIKHIMLEVFAINEPHEAAEAIHFAKNSQLFKANNVKLHEHLE
ncbi:CLUMA_CG019879, isoform A [Clunio marinus]|uniref:CLUMA_CG019879, isoform A n=1 Tax=Clunio marinus TaxID=568069 RepID=A0A1J1J2I9_9DIPT|nr:CLUMA_CG019879, isoform A [Clunio marinus]